MLRTAVRSSGRRFGQRWRHHCMAWRPSVLGYGVGRHHRGHRMDLDHGAKRKSESQARAINDLYDGNCDRGVAPRAAVVQHRAIDYPSDEAMIVIALGFSLYSSLRL